jgi:hypothetical protein
MAFRLQRRIRLFGDLRLNLSKRGLGLSAGIPGLRVGLDARGRAYGSAGLPGSGLSDRRYAKRGDPHVQRYQDGLVIGIMICVVIVLLLVIVANWQR